MTCETVQRELSLCLYGELSFEAEEAVHQHLEVCEECRRMFEREQALHQAIDLAEREVPSALLHGARQDLRNRLQMEREARRSSSASWWRASWWRSLAPAPLLKPLAAAALIAIGFFGARLTPVTGPGGWNGADADVAARVRYVTPEPSGRLRLVVDETRRRVVSGRPEDARIRTLLLAAARDPADPGLRVESIEILKDNAESEDVRRALLHALRHDPNPGVRLKAIEGLKPYAGEAEMRRVLADVLLTDDNPGVRTQAIDLLVERKHNEVVRVLQELLRHEENGYIRLRSQKALREMNASVETF
ncbi:MAG: HEAT repeat domain-containing protein [Bryobacteraceae bacterium]